MLHCQLTTRKEQSQLHIIFTVNVDLNQRMDMECSEDIPEFNLGSAGSPTPPNHPAEFQWNTDRFKLILQLSFLTTTSQKLFRQLQDKPPSGGKQCPSLLYFAVFHSNVEVISQARCCKDSVPYPSSHAQITFQSKLVPRHL